MLKMILIAVVLLVAGVLVYAAMRPDHFHVERRIAIAAPPEQVYPFVVDLHHWTQWSPYETKDPDMKREFSGAASGVGASYAWDGDRNIGAGRMTIGEATAPQRVVIRLDFTRPFAAHNLATFTLQPDGNGSEVVWAIDGPAPFVSRLMGLFFDMDRMIGRDFEAGLAKLKAVAESAPASATDTTGA